jgi:hypothetical protein
VGDHGCEGISPTSLERSRRSQGRKAPWVRLNVSAFVSPGRTRPFKARSASALRARRASSPIWRSGWRHLEGWERPSSAPAGAGFRVVVCCCPFQVAADAGERHGVSEVGQVGVNPRRRNGRSRGCRRSPRGACEPWAVQTQLVTSRKNDTTHRAVACHRVHAAGFRQSGSCLGVHTIAEVDGRHAAQALR